MDNKTVVAALAALAQDSRLAVFRLLVQAGPERMAATKIAEQLEIPPSWLQMSANYAYTCFYYSK